jgi:hypothetical protein
MTLEARQHLTTDDSALEERRGLLRQALDFVFGYDFFISYAWSDGAVYAAALARQLEAEGFEVFLDREEYASGDDWKKVGAWTLKRTGQLILVGTQAALHSAPVLREVEIFMQTKRRIVPIDFDGALRWNTPDTQLAKLLPAEILRVQESTTALTSGPALATVASIRRTFNLVRQDKKRIRAFATIAILLSLLAIAATGFAYYAQRQHDTAEQRSAMLAAEVSQTFTNDGKLDPALLLMIEAARWFDDSSAPDEIRIALTQALERKARIQSNVLFRDMKVFETPGALILADPKTNDIFRLTNASAPARLVAGLRTESPVISLQQGRGAGDLILLRENHEVERVNIGSGERRKIGIFEEPKQIEGRSYTVSSDERGMDTRFAEGGLIVRGFTFNNPAGDQGNYAQIMDAGSGRVIEGELPFEPVAYARAADGAIIVFRPADNRGGPERVFKLVATPTGFTLQEARFDANALLPLRYGNCVATAKGSVRGPMLKAIKDLSSSGKSVCKKSGENYLLTTFEYGSAGEIRSDAQIGPDGNQSDVRDLFAQVGVGALSGNNFNWVGIEPVSGAVGALLNRDVMLEADGDLKLKFRLETMPLAARFVDASQLIVAEGESGRVVAFDLREPPKREGTLFSKAMDANIVGTKRAVTTLHHGNCVGGALPREDFDVMPDGRKILYETSSMSNFNEKNEIHVISGSKGVTISLDGAKAKESSCLQFSDDWKQMLIVGPTGVSLYDFNRVLAAGSLKGNEAGKIGGSRMFSAFFVPRTRAIVTADGSTKVLLWEFDARANGWKSRELYRGENPIFYAEPDADAGNLILEDQVGKGETHGFLYSVKANRQWFDLGRDYKWLGIAFTSRQEVVVSKHWNWTNVFPVLPLSTLVELAKMELSPSCNPRVPGEYRSSSCWPSALQ